MKKTNLHGVGSISTKNTFKELKKKGFSPSLENGSKETFKIIVLINGVEFVISCVDGSKPIYTKGYSRSKWKWIKFECLDDLVLASLIKKNSKPTDSQQSYFNNLLSDITKFAGVKPKIKTPKTVVEMKKAINEAIQAKFDARNKERFSFNGSYIILSNN